MVSSSEYQAQGQGYDTSTYDSGYGAPPRRQDPNQLLMLPAPLSVTRTTPTSASTSTAGLSRSSEEGGYASDIGSQQQRLISPEGYPRSEEFETPPVGHHYAQQGSPFDARVSRTAGANNAVYRQSSTNQYTVETVYHQSPSNHQHSAETYSYSYSQPQSTVYDGEQHQFPYTSDPEELPAAPSAAAGRSRSRGVSLADNGPVPAPGGVRRIPRQNRRSTSQVPPQQNPNRYSRGGSVPMPQQYNSSLPPGAAPPRPGGGYGY
jgi:chitin synthase